MSILDQVAKTSYAFRSAKDMLSQRIGVSSTTWAEGYAKGVLMALWEQDLISAVERDVASRALDSLVQRGRSE